MRGIGEAAAVVVCLIFGAVTACGQARDETARARSGEGQGGAAGLPVPSGGSSAAGGSAVTGGANPGSGGAVGGVGGSLVTGGTTSGSGGAPSAGGLDSAGCDPTGSEEEKVISAILAGPTSWTGEVETTVTTRAESDAGLPPQKLVLRIDSAGKYAQGTVVFGSGAPPERPTSLDVPWPPGEPFTGSGPWRFAPYEGFDYAIVSAEVEANTLRVQFVPNEIYRDWCPLTWNAYDLCSCPSEGSLCRAKVEPKRRMTLVAGVRLLCGKLSTDPWEPDSGGIPMKLERTR